MTRNRSLTLIIGLWPVLLGLSGCSRDPTPTLARLLTVIPTQALLVATSPPPPPVATATYTPTSPPPTVTATRQPTNRPTLRAEPQGEANQPTTITATTNALPPTFPRDVNPLTGLPVADPAVLERCPLAIKVSNAPAVVRPQAGLDKADLVFEHYAEGGVTRLTAVFLGQTPTVVGSVRSGRLIDLEIPAMFKALFAYSGSSAGVGQRYVASDLYPDRIASPWSAGAAFYRRDLDKAYEHTLFVDPTALWAEAERRGISSRQDLRGMTFDPNPPLGGTPANEVTILYQAGISQVEWVYNTPDGRYYRWQGGTAHREELTGAQMSAANVIVVGANHVETNILEDTWGGGHWSIEIQIWGEGPVSIFRDGQRYDGIWLRRDRNDMLSFWTRDGSQRLPLKPGNSWFQMVPLGFTGLFASP